jgi:hypothetical protein
MVLKGAWLLAVIIERELPTRAIGTKEVVEIREAGGSL